MILNSSCFTRLLCYLKFWGPRVVFLMVEFEFWAWWSNLEIPEFASTLERGSLRSSDHSECVHSVRATKSPLERELQAPRSFMSFTDRSSEGMCARATILIMHVRSSVDWDQPVLFSKFTNRSSEGMCARATPFILYVRSSEEVYARAGTLFSEILPNCSNLCFGILIAS